MKRLSYVDFWGKMFIFYLFFVDVHNWHGAPSREREKRKEVVSLCIWKTERATQSVRSFPTPQPSVTCQISKFPAGLGFVLSPFSETAILRQEFLSC